MPSSGLRGALAEDACFDTIQSVCRSSYGLDRIEGDACFMVARANMSLSLIARPPSSQGPAESVRRNACADHGIKVNIRPVTLGSGFRSCGGSPSQVHAHAHENHEGERRARAKEQEACGTLAPVSCRDRGIGCQNCRDLSAACGAGAHLVPRCGHPEACPSWILLPPCISGVITVCCARPGRYRVSSRLSVTPGLVRLP